jgi:uncharacterized protein YbjT (DUF2867 family)
MRSAQSPDQIHRDWKNFSGQMPKQSVLGSTETGVRTREETIMTKPRIIVTGATGKTGSVVTTELLKAGYPVRAMVHREDGRSAQLKAQGAEIAVADISDVERVADALKDVQRAYFCPPFDPYMIQGAVAFAVAAKEARLEHVVSLTQWLASPSHPALMTRQHWLVDRLFSMTPGVAHTIVNPGFFADAYLATIGLAAHLGVFPWMYGNSRNAPPSNEDIARVVVATLIDPARHAGKTYRPTGPELLGAEDMARAIGLSKVTRDLMEYREFEERTRKLNRELRARVSELTEYQRQVELRTLNLSRGMAQPGRRKRPFTFKEIQGVLGPIESSCGGAL